MPRLATSRLRYSASVIINGTMGVEAAQEKRHGVLMLGIIASKAVPASMETPFFTFSSAELGNTSRTAHEGIGYMRSGATELSIDSRKG